MKKKVPRKPKTEPYQIRINAINWAVYKDWCLRDGAPYCFLSTSSKFNLWLQNLRKKSG